MRYNDGKEEDGRGVLRRVEPTRGNRKKIGRVIRNNTGFSLLVLETDTRLPVNKTTRMTEMLRGWN